MTRAVLKDVVNVRHVGGHRLWLRFEDGVEGILDLLEVIPDFRGVLQALLDPEFVAQVRVHPEFGTITWPGDLDLDPVVLYCAVQGIPVPTHEAAPDRAARKVVRTGARRQSIAREPHARRRRPTR